MKKDKTFDCVEMKKKGAAIINEKMKDMTFEEKVEFWKRRSEEFEQWRNALKSQQQT